MPTVNPGSLNPIAVMGRKRDPAEPNIPAAGESLPDFDFASNLGIGLPRAMPPEIIAKINADVNRVIRSEALAPRLRDMGLIVTGSTPEQFDAHMRRSLKTFSDSVRQAKGTRN